MTKAFPPRRPLRDGWVALAIALGILLPTAAKAQQGDDPAKTAGAAKGADAPKGQGKAEAKGTEKAKEEVPDDQKIDADEKANAATETIDGPDRWEDPRAVAAMENTFPELPGVVSSPADKILIDKLSKGQESLDLAAIDRYVRSRAAMLTKKSYLKALIEPDAKGADPRPLEVAARELMAPMLVPASSANKSFRDAYVKKLIESFAKIWSGHLHSRTFAMIVLSRSGDPQALPVFAAQMKDPEQLAIVKLLAAVGISRVALDGRRDVDDVVAIPAAKALADFLKREPETFWPAQFRAVEGLGSLRLATESPLGTKAEFAEVLVSLAVDPKTPPTVRAWASWALGMLRVPNSVRTYNYPLVANVIGAVAADLGSKVVEQPDTAQGKMRSLANLLVQTHFGLIGDPNTRTSGLARSNHPGAALSQAHIAEVEKRVRVVTKASYDLSTGPRSQMQGQRATLLAAIEDLRTFLMKPIPAGRSLYAGAVPVPEPTAPAVAGGGRQ